ncbi:MAG: PHP-associated domain-containing protein [Methanomassiliicoccaceae archaeon]|nr:PHP-associated domain-containing protein [Methanomassiliicoccaceae archaeon]
MKADLHIHSSFSLDGRTDPVTIVDVAVERGIGCIAITDHNSFEAYDLIKDDGRLIVIPGEEVSSKGGHILAYGIDRQIQKGLSIIETIEAIHDAGGIAFAAHPYRWWSGLGEQAVLDNPFDGIEAANSRSYNKDNLGSAALAAKVGCPVSAGSDAHTTRHIGFGYVTLPDGLTSWSEVLREMMSGPLSAISSNRHTGSTLRYGIRSIGLWMSRGFRKM